MAFNKMFVMLPVMLAARKLDGENPDTVFMLRCAYGTVQAVIVLLVAYIYISSQAVSNGKDKDRLIYVPPPPVVSHSFAKGITPRVLLGLLIFFHRANRFLLCVSARIPLTFIIVLLHSS